MGMKPRVKKTIWVARDAFGAYVVNHTRMSTQNCVTVVGIIFTDGVTICDKSVDHLGIRLEFGEQREFEITLKEVKQ